MKRALATLLFLSTALACTAHAEQAPTRPSATSLTHPKSATQPVDAHGFIHRWLVLEPVPVTGRLTESAVEEAVQSAPVPGAMDSLPRDGESVMLANSSATWHAL